MKKSDRIIVLVALLLLIILGVGMYYYVQSSRQYYQQLEKKSEEKKAAEDKAAAVAHAAEIKKYPTQPPSVELVSDWSYSELPVKSLRYIKIDDRLAIENRDGAIAFVPTK